MNHRIPFKNENALQRLRVGDTLNADSNMGGSFTFNITARTDEGLTLARKDEDAGTLTQDHTWADLKENFFLSPSYSIAFRTTMHHLQLLDKAGYTEPEEMKEALGCSLADITEGLEKKVTVFYAITRPNSPPAIFANEYDAKAVSNWIKPVEITNAEYLNSKVHQNILSHDIDDVCLDIELETPHDLPIGHMLVLASRALAVSHPSLMKAGGHQSMAKSSMMTLPNSESMKGALSTLFNASYDTAALSQPLRAQAILNADESYEKGTPPHDYQEITLLVNAEPVAFKLASIHNQQHILYNEDKGVMGPDLCKELMPLLDNAIKQSKKVVHDTPELAASPNPTR
jgi:hypothetical protein